jgi:Holliday junction resolvase RusA-like endonuclease
VRTLLAMAEPLTRLRFRCAIPPSANALWRLGRRQGGRGRLYRDPAYGAWLQAECLQLRVGRRRVRTPCRVSVIILGGEGWPESRDIDNLWKATLDLVRHAGIIPDDSVRHVRGVSAEYVPPETPGARAECWVEVVSVGEGG